MRNIVVFMVAAVVMFSSALAAHDFPQGAAPYEKSRRCSGCHPAVYKEWESSMHSKSSVHKDPAHSAMYGEFTGSMKDAGKEGGYPCAACHMPMAENIKELMNGTDTPNGNLWREDEGVGCAFCHRAETITGGKDRKRLFTINKDGAYLTSNKPEKAPHAVAANPMFAGGELCMGCHSPVESQSAICLTEEEGQSNCLSCHMERKEGPPSIESAKTDHASHEMGGGHNITALFKALSVNAKVNETGNGGKTLDIEVINNTSHSFPSSMPMRMSYLKVVAYDAKKQVIFSNDKESSEDGNAVFMKASGGGTSFDRRLLSGGTRAFSYPIPNDGVKSIIVEVIYRLFQSQAIISHPALTALKNAGDKEIDANFTIYKKEFIF
ncbi:MAG: hypothetical protein HQK99_05365 [Nitrospirae bacterium]|nr:hypothetical protein [Nitrospirota bacterium]